MMTRSLGLIRYWGRKPPSMISKYIEEFSKRGDLILDPFGGSGSIIRTALMLERRAIYVDLNPFAKLVAESTIVGCSLENLVKAVKDVIEEEKFRIKIKGKRTIEVNARELFSIECPCGKSVEVSSVSFGRVYTFKSEPEGLTRLQRKVLDVIQEHGSITHEELVERFPNSPRNGITNALKYLIKHKAVNEKTVPVRVTYVEPCVCGVSKLDKLDVLRWLVKNPVYPAYWYPRAKMRYPDGEVFLKKRDVERVYELFDYRTLAYLSYLWYKIRGLRISPATRRCLYSIFMATLARSSKMNRASGGTWPINSYWIPRTYLVRNPRLTFLRAVEDFSDFLSTCGQRPKSGHPLKVIEGKANVAFVLGDAKSLPLPKSSVDYVITDPPHVDEAQFFELSVFYTSWMKKKLDFENELVVNPKQGKNLTKYFKMYSSFVSEVKRILKPGRFFTVILHEESKSILRMFIEITENLGFSLHDSNEVDNFYLFTFIKKDD
jgi:hypothetical protein